jgi:hypothetical protein
MFYKYSPNIVIGKHLALIKFQKNYYLFILNQLLTDIKVKLVIN